MKQEYKVESLNTCTCELQQQTYAQRLELEDAHLGHLESRREQVRPQEELVVKEKALRDAQIRSTHEMGESKESSGIAIWRILCTKIERKSWYDTKAHFTDTRVVRETELHEWFRRMSGYRIELRWNFSHVSSHPVVVPSLRSMLSRDKCMPFDTWNRSETTSNVRNIGDVSSRNSSLYNSKCYRLRFECK